MYTSVIKILKSHSFYGGTGNVEFAKGHREIPSNWKSFVKQFKRIINGKRGYKL
jgi:hypothetical protein